MSSKLNSVSMWVQAVKYWILKTVVKINLDEEDKLRTHGAGSPFDRIKRRKGVKKVKIPTKFINHILSLGFSKNDAPRLYEKKNDWMGINSGGAVFCTRQGCKFQTKLGTNELFEHCRLEHAWRDYPCHHENCKYVAYCGVALNKHKQFHSKSQYFKHDAFRCSKPNCRAGFARLSMLKEHEKIHNNVKLECIFCPYTCVESSKLLLHQRAHFNFRDYECEG